MKKLRVELVAWLVLMTSFVIVCAVVYGYRGKVLGQFHAQSFDTLLGDARDYSRSGNPAQAEAVFSTLLDRYPNNEELLVAYGEFLDSLDRADDAEAAYAHAASLGRQRFSSARRYAGFLESNGRTDEAVAFLNEYLTRFPDDLTAQLDLGFMRLRLKDWAGAVDALQKAAERPSLEFAARTNLAGAYAQLGEEEEAIHEWQRVVAMGPEPAKQLFLQNIAVSYELLHRPDAARETWQAYLDRFPNSMLGAERVLKLAKQYGTEDMQKRAELRLQAVSPEIPFDRPLAPGLRVAGISRPIGDLAPDQDITLEVWFPIDKTIEQTLTVEFMLRYPDGQSVALTGEPAAVGTAPLWRGDTVRQPFAVILPDDLPEGRCTMLLTANASNAKPVSLWEFTRDGSTASPPEKDAPEEAPE